MINQSGKLILIGLSLAVLVIALYLPSLKGGYYHDDIPNLVYNTKLQLDELNVDNISQAATSSGAGKLKRPISMVSFALNYYLFGQDPFSFKAVNLALHLITGILVFFLVYRLKEISSDSDRKTILLFAVAVTLVWVIHPLQVSTVAYIVQRMAILSTLFILSSVLLYLHGRIRQIEGKSAGIYFIAGSIICVLLGIFSKENGILALPLIGLVELTLFQFRCRIIHDRRWLITLATVSVSTAILFILFYLPDIEEYLARVYARREFTLEERLLTQARVVSSYIKWYFVPDLREMGLFHDDISISRSLLVPFSTLPSILFLATLLAISLVVIRKYTLITIGLGWFFIGHLLESTFIPLEIAYEHRNYLPSVGLTIAAAETIHILLVKKPHISPYRWTAGFLIVLILSVATFLRSTQWADPLSFNYIETQHHPSSARANHALGMQYRNLALSGFTHFKEDAYTYLTKAASLNDSYIYSEAAMIKMAYELKEKASPQWLNQIVEKLKHAPINFYHADILKDLTQCNPDQCMLDQQACVMLFDAVFSNPSLYESGLSYSKTLAAKANFLLEHRLSTSQAEDLLLKAIEVSPHRIQYYVDYINLLLILNRSDDAIQYLKLAYASDKKDEHTLELDSLNNIVKLHSNEQS